MDFWVFVLCVVMVKAGRDIVVQSIRSRMALAEKRQDAGQILDTAAIHSLREELRALRDTTLQYDLSFDAALQRMEQRVERLERQGTTQGATQQEARLVI